MRLLATLCTILLLSFSASADEVEEQPTEVQTRTSIIKYVLDHTTTKKGGFRYRYVGGSRERPYYIDVEGPVQQRGPGLKVVVRF